MSELTVVLDTPSWMRVTVFDDETLERIVDPWIFTSGEDVLEQDSRAARKGDELGLGERYVLIPQSRFKLKVRKDGYEPFEVGPFEPPDAPEDIEVRLHALAGVSGRVVFEGQPVEGAAVQMLRAVASGQTATTYGFRMRVEPRSGVTVKTDADGRFKCSSGRRGSYILVVRKEGLANGERGPLEFDPQQDMSGIDVALVGGGTIEGLVLLPPGVNKGGKIVGVSRGDGDVRFTRTKDDGLYRFENLTPGGWQVAHHRREVNLSTTYAAHDGEPPPIEWDCEVVNGGITRHDIDVRDATPGVLRGRLLIDDIGAIGWGASLVRDIDGGVVDPVRSVALAADGSFELRGAPGDWRLRLQGPPGVEPAISVSQDLTLAEVPLEWRENLATATLTGTSHAGDAALSFVWTDARGIRCSARFMPAPDGTFHARVPAGTGRILRLGTHPDGSSPGLSGWLPAGEATVAVGETLEIDLP